MKKDYNRYNLEIEFKKYLIAENVSNITIKNYLSDIRYFLGWMNANLYHIEGISKGILYQYINYLLQNKIPSRTVNRRLSSLRKLSKYLVLREIVSTDFTEGISNINMQETNEVQLLLKEYEEYLDAEEIEERELYKSTIKELVSKIY